LVVDVWSRKVVAWDVADREDAQIAADLVSRACLRERISKGRRLILILHADNGNAMRAATLESRLEELGVLRSFSRPSAAVGLHVIAYNLIRLGNLLTDRPWQRREQQAAQRCAQTAASTVPQRG
jgi:hypothetical protein